MVLLRDHTDMRVPPSAEGDVITGTTAGINWRRHDPTSKHWYGYTFDPHISRRKAWLDLGGFSHLEHERRISRTFRKNGKFCYLLDPGACHHGGDHNSMRKTMPKVETSSPPRMKKRHGVQEPQKNVA